MFYTNHNNHEHLRLWAEKPDLIQSFSLPSLQGPQHICSSKTFQTQVYSVSKGDIWLTRAGVGWRRGTCFGVKKFLLLQRPTEPPIFEGRKGTAARRPDCSTCITPTAMAPSQVFSSQPLAKQNLLLMACWDLWISYKYRSMTPDS